LVTGDPRNTSRSSVHIFSGLAFLRKLVPTGKALCQTGGGVATRALSLESSSAHARSTAKGVARDTTGKAVHHRGHGGHRVRRKEEKAGKHISDGQVRPSVLKVFLCVLCALCGEIFFRLASPRGLPRDVGQSLFGPPVTSLTICDTENALPIGNDAQMR
jgi:hypothetical protein